MNKKNIIKLSSVIVIVLFIILFLASTILYFIYNPFKENIVIETQVCKWEDLQKLNDILQEKLEVKNNNIYVFNGGEVEFDFAENELTNIYFELLVKQEKRYEHYQLQLENNKIVLKNFGKVKENNIAVQSRLGEVLEPISKIIIEEDKMKVKILVDNAIINSISNLQNNYIYQSSVWERVLQPVAGKFFRVMIHNVDSNIIYNKNYYIQYKEVYL